MTRAVSAPVLLEGWIDDVPDVTVDALYLQAEEAETGGACVVRDREQAEIAAGRGAALLIHDASIHVPGPATAGLPGLEHRLSELASRFYHYPSEELKIAAVAGCSGRVSAVHYIAQSWQRVEGEAALVGRHGCGPFRAASPPDPSRLDPATLQRTLAGCVEAGIGMAALEMLPGFLERGWADDLAIDVAVFTSAVQAHGLDHGGQPAADEEAATRRLFTDCRPQFAVINHDEAEGKTLSRLAAAGTQVLTFGTNGATELQGAVLNMDSSGMTLRIASPWGGGEVRTGLLGRRNLSTLLATAGALALMGMNWNRVMHQVEIMSAAPGRMNCIAGDPGQPAAVLDSALTPAALEDVLLALRAHLHGRLHCVLAGTDDPEMRRVAEFLSDQVYPVFGGDRREVIREALAGSGHGDILLITGDWGDGHVGSGEASVLDLLEEAA